MGKLVQHTIAQYVRFSLHYCLLNHGFVILPVTVDRYRLSECITVCRITYVYVNRISQLRWCSMSNSSDTTNCVYNYLTFTNVHIFLYGYILHGGIYPCTLSYIDAQNCRILNERVALPITSRDMIYLTYKLITCMSLLLYKKITNFESFKL